MEEKLRDAGSISEWARSPGEENGNSLQYSCLDNPMDRGVWRATVHGVGKSRTPLSDSAHEGVFTIARIIGNVTKSVPSGSAGKKFTCQCRRRRFDFWVRKIPWRTKWQFTPAFLPGKFHGLRSPVGYSPWGRKESDTTERLHIHT